MNNTCINPQLVRELQQDGYEMQMQMGWMDMVVMQWLTMKIDALASRICVGLRWIPADEFPLQIPSGGEVSAISGCSVCRLPDPIARGETI